MTAAIEFLAGRGSGCSWTCSGLGNIKLDVQDRYAHYSYTEMILPATTIVDIFNVFPF